MVNSRVGSGLWRAPVRILHSSEARRSHLPTQIDSLSLSVRNQEKFKFCIDCLNEEVLTERQQHICRLCDKEFSTIDDAYQHIDSEHCQHYDTLTKDEGEIKFFKSGPKIFKKISSNLGKISNNLI